MSKQQKGSGGSDSNGTKGQEKVAVVDGANAAFEEMTATGKARVSNLVAMRRVLEEKGYEVIIIADAALKHKVDDPDQLESMFDDQVVRQAPAETDADFFVIEIAEQRGGWIVSNDRYRDYAKEHSWISERRIPYMIVDGVVTLYEEKEPQ